MNQPPTPTPLHGSLPEPPALSRSEIVEALDLWTDGPTKDRLVDFLDQMVNGPDPVPLAQRIAAFDNDGTVAVEKPHNSVQSFLHQLADGLDPTGPVGHRVRRLLPKSFAYLLALPAMGSDVDSYAAQSAQFIETYRHPRYDMAWPQLVYAPMRQLMILLHRLGFAVFLVSGSSRDFLRVMAPSYGLLPPNIIGTEFRVEYRDGVLRRSRRIPQPDVGREKPEHLWNRSGGHPLIAFGNTHHDIELLRSARFAGLVRHDDADREYAYTDQRAEQAAAAEGWLVASMREDFAVVIDG